MTLTALEEAEIIPGKDSDTRIKPLALTNVLNKDLDTLRHMTIYQVNCIVY
jgi:hypothetical protein